MTLTHRTAHDLASLIRAREVSCVDVVRAHLERMDQVNAALHAVVQVRAEAAFENARRADAALLAGHDVGPLHGVPFTVKDWIDTNDLPCAGGMDPFRARVPQHDATTVARLRLAGAILLGKTKPGLDETVYPAARNPFDLDRTPGATCGSA